MQRSLVAAVLVVGGQAFIPSALAEAGVPATVINEPSNYFSLMPGYLIADRNRGATRHGGTASAVFGYQFAPHFSFETNVQGSIIERGVGQNGDDFYQEGGTLDLVYSLFDRRNSWTPYVLAGIGGVYNDVNPNDGDKASFLADAGLGFVTGPLLGMKLRVEARYNHDFYHEFAHRGFNDYRFLGGFEIPFGGQRQVVVVEKEVPKIVEVVKEVPRVWVDSDGDGVDDEHDKCPDTPKGLKVDATGCAIPGQSIELRGVTFEFNKATLVPNAQTVLDYVSKGLLGQPTMKVELAGHTDAIGGAEYNQKLSQKRAESVRAYLIGKGVKPDQLIAKGYGKSRPLITPEKNDTDRALNRRVEFRVLEK